MQGYNGVAGGRRAVRTPEQRRRNRRVGIIAALVAVLMMVGSAFYIAYFGGVNKGPMKPFHSGVMTAAQSFGGRG